MHPHHPPIKKNKISLLCHKLITRGRRLDWEIISPVAIFTKWSLLSPGKLYFSAIISLSTKSLIKAMLNGRTRREVCLFRCLNGSHDFGNLCTCPFCPLGLKICHPEKQIFILEKIMSTGWRCSGYVLGLTVCTWIPSNDLSATILMAVLHVLSDFWLRRRHHWAVLALKIKAYANKN